MQEGARVLGDEAEGTARHVFLIATLKLREPASASTPSLRDIKWLTGVAGTFRPTQRCLLRARKLEMAFDGGR